MLMLSHTKSSVPLEKQKNLMYKTPCHDCRDFYIGQTSRPLVKQIKEHKACYCLNNCMDSSTSNIKSTPVKHTRENGHLIDWKKTSILTTCDHKSQLNLLEHAAIINLAPSMNMQHKGPRVNGLWESFFVTITNGLITYQISKFDAPFGLFILHISCSCRAEEDK